MPLATKAGQKALAEVLASAEDRLWARWSESAALQHSTTKGSSREAAVRQFLQAQLPDRFGFANGEAIDILGNRTGQIDLIVYDRLQVGPFYATKTDASATDALLPAEALLATIEVKSVLNRQAAEHFASGVSRIHSLRPYEKRFTYPRASGKSDDGEPRVQSTLFAFESDLGEEGWAAKELKRLRESAQALGCPHEGLDRLVVLDRGLIIPAEGQALLRPDEKGVLRIWFFHLVNFLAREAARRRPFTWAAYADPADEAGRVQIGTPLAPGRSAKPASAARSTLQTGSRSKGGRRRRPRT